MNRVKIHCFYKIRCLRLFGIQAITLYPWILFVESPDKVPARLFRHELEHIYQVQRLGWLRFYSSYLISYLKLRLNGFNHHESYFRISYEAEAREKEVLPLTALDMQLLGIKSSPVRHA